MNVKDNVRNFLHRTIDNSAKFIKDNKVGIGLTLATGGGGAIKGAVSKTGLHFSKKMASKATRKAIIDGAKTGAKNSVIKGVLTSTAAKIILDPDAALNETKVGKTIDKKIDWLANQAHKGINRLFGGGSY